MTEHEPHGATPADAELTPQHDAAHVDEASAAHDQTNAQKSPAASQQVTPAPVPVEHAHQQSAPAGGAPDNQQGQAPHGQPGQHFAGHPGGAPVVAPKSPPLAALCSFFIVGLGQLITGRVGAAITFFCVMGAMGALSFLLTALLLGWIVWPFMFCFWLWNIYDAYTGAQKWNARHGIIS